MLQTEILELAKGGNVKEIAKIANINNRIPEFKQVKYVICN